MNRQQHLLVCLMEECSELQQAVSKALRFGLDDVYSGKSNIEQIKQEMADVLAVFDLAMAELDEDVDELEMVEAARAKQNKLKNWMDYSTHRGLLHGDN